MRSEPICWFGRGLEDGRRRSGLDSCCLTWIPFHVTSFYVTEKVKKKKKFLVIRPPPLIFGGDKDQRGGFHSSKPGGSGWSSPSKAWTQGGSSRNAEDRQDLSQLGVAVVSLLFTQGLVPTGSRSGSDTNIIIVITAIIIVGLVAFQRFQWRSGFFSSVEVVTHPSSSAVFHFVVWHWYDACVL